MHSRSVRTGTILLLAILGTSSAPAAEPLVSVRIVVPEEAASGTILEASFGIETLIAGILGWSLALEAKDLVFLSADTTGTDFERLRTDGYTEIRSRADGSALSAVAALSFTGPVSLPVGRSEVLRARVRPTRLEPGEARIEAAESLQFPGESAVFRNEVLYSGGSVAALAVSPGVIEVLGCVRLRPTAEGGGTPATLTVHRDDPVRLEVRLLVAGERYLDPTGFQIAAALESAALEFRSASFPAAIEEDLLGSDGVSAIEVLPAVLSARASSPGSAPRTLGVGEHLALELDCRFTGRGRPGDRFPMRFYLADSLDLGGSTARTVLEPGPALPCTLESLEIELVLGPDRWVRGDANVDGKVDIADGIGLLGHLFLGGSAPCLRAMEINLDGKVDLSDAVSLLGHLFLGGPAPAQPFPECGSAEEDLECDVFRCPSGA
jgi:hypothetical protein